MKNLSLTLYVDETSVKITEVVAPAHFRSIALSLPTPEEHGGIYALCIPTDAMYGYTGTATLPASGFAVITIGAQEQGTLSGEVSYPSALNIRADSVSETLSDLDAYLDGLHTDGRDGLVGDAFSPNRYAYRVYIGHDDDTVYLYAKFPLSTIVDTVLESFQVTATESTMGTDRVVTAVVDMTGVTEKTVRLKKTDTVTVDGKTVTLNSVVYKITLVKKTVYTMELSSLDKTYDGLPAAPAVKRIYAPETGEDYSPSAEELAALEFTYYREDGTSYTEMGTQPPKNAGRYKVSAVLHGETCTAFGEATFTISRRILTVSRIQNHLTYVSMAEHNTWTAPRDIDDPGTIILSGIIGTDDVSATAERVYYNDISIGYDMYKITLTGIVLAGADVENYETASTQRVFGQISYSLDGAIFRKKPGLPWDKFYPVDSLVPVSEDTADYHSPATDGVYDAHGDYVYARTQNRGDESSVYAVDISFGAMCFSYSRAQWNPDSMIYEELAGESRWNGFDGSNNAVSVTNRSNSPVYYAANCKIHFLHAAIGSSTVGIRADFYPENAAGSAVTGRFQLIPAATPGDTGSYGTAQEGRCYIRLSGVPQLGDSDHFTVVGSVTVTISRQAE